VQSTLVAARLRGIDIKKATVAIEGFGNVGTFAFDYLQKLGSRIVSVADSRGAIYNEKGLDFKKMMGLKKKGRSVCDYKPGKKMDRSKIFGLNVDILIPASVTDVIDDSNKHHIKANAGGVISSYAEYRGYNPKKMFELVEKKIKKSTLAVLEESIKRKVNPRIIAMEIAQKRLGFKK